MLPSQPTLIIIVPCYNEEEVLRDTAEKLSCKITSLVSGQLISEKSALLFIDDGSKDNTWALIEKCNKENPLVFYGIKLAGNSGQQTALFCGLISVKDSADVTISIDADLQDDIDAIDKMLDNYFAGAEIVYGVRSDRKNDGLIKRGSARLFYRLMRFLGAGLVDNHADFRLMSRKAIEALAEYSAGSLFLRGIAPMLGLKTGTVYYERKKRFAGKSKYTLPKMLGLAAAGISSLRKKKAEHKKFPDYRIEKILFGRESLNEDQ